MRRTKIVATLGPATDRPGMLARLVAAGLDAARLNYSHGNQEDHARRAREVREAAQAAGREIGLIADLQGPKIRLECFRDGPVELVEGRRFLIDAGLAPDAGDVERVGVTYTALPGDVQAGDTLLVDDGRIVLGVERVTGKVIETTVVTGGTLSDHKGINRQGGGLSAPALTPKDRADLVHALGPLHEHQTVRIHQVAEAEPLELVGVRQAVKVQMGHRQAPALVEMHQGVGRTPHAGLPGHVQGLAERARQEGLAGAERALERHDIAGLQGFRQPGGPARGRFFGVAVEAQHRRPTRSESRRPRRCAAHPAP